MEENIGNFSLAKIQSILSNRKYLLIIVLIFVGSVFGLLSLIPSKKEPPATGLPHPSINPSIPFDNISYPSKPPTTISPFPKKDAIIAKVGEENIYQSDLNIEMDGYPPVKNLDVRDFLLKKIVSDSIILQGGQKDNIVKLDDGIFNNPNKDYKKRIQSVEQVKKAIEEQAEQIEGYVVSIWFYNDNLGSLGYDGGKKFALDKITKLHEDVKSGKLTVIQAGEAIKNDASLAQIDVNYKGNAIFQFKNKKTGDSITFDSDFDAALWKLKESETSDVFALKDKNYKTGIVNEALYTFGQVDKIIVNPNLTNFNSWLEKYKKSYEIKYF